MRVRRHGPRFTRNDGHPASCGVKVSGLQPGAIAVGRAFHAKLSVPMTLRAGGGGAPPAEVPVTFSLGTRRIVADAVAARSTMRARSDHGALLGGVVVDAGTRRPNDEREECTVCVTLWKTAPSLSGAVG